MVAEHGWTAADGRAGRMFGPVSVAVLGVGALVTAWFLDPSEGLDWFPPPCVVNLVLGISCPLCGGTRMVHNLVHGDLLAAADYNALALLALPVTAVVYIVWTVRSWRGTGGTRARSPRLLTIGVPALLLVWTVVRNLPVEPFRVLGA